LSFFYVISYCIQDLPHPNLEVMFTTARGLWQAWNYFLWDEKIAMVEEICKSATGVAIDFLESGLDVHNGGGRDVVDDFGRW
jgi:hypothetical protein